MKRRLHDGREDGLDPLETLDLRKTESFSDLLARMSKTAFGGRALGEAYHVFREMAGDPSCLIVVTVSGAMTIAKMGKVLCDMIDEGLAHIVVSTGALMAHGLSEAIGGVHYKHDETKDDVELFEKGYNRVYDTLEMEANLCAAERLVSEVLDRHDWSRPTSSHEFNREIGRRLFELGQMPSILGNAYAKGVPVYVPAFTDSELGLDVATHAMKKSMEARGSSGTDVLFSEAPPFNPFLDLFDYTRRILAAKTVGIFTIGGGVPRNWAQQVGPFVDITNMRLGTEISQPRFRYGIRICPEPTHWGGLSGCTYREGVSWGKFVPREEGGRFAEVYCDATIAWPILVRALLETKR
ncbi:MAG: deoxyhypusine synthase family protein [Candidatus Eisenbacteria bacterium]|nr:deoxyhypusine synthase family protein [Candidatus Eisenbacteria bacterium]